MDNGEDVQKLQGQPEALTSYAPERDTQALGKAVSQSANRAMNQAIFSSEASADSETIVDSEQIQAISEHIDLPEAPNPLPKAPEQTTEQPIQIQDADPLQAARDESQATNSNITSFNPNTIYLSGDHISQAALDAAHSVESLITRGHDPAKGFSEYQALRKINNGKAA